MNCFLIMPYHDSYDDVLHAIKRAAAKAGDIRCHRLDEHQPGGRIVPRLVEALESADLCIADLSGDRPNVMWELGYAMAKGKHAILLTQNPGELPFDLHDVQRINYDRNRLVDTLESRLAASLRDSADALRRLPKGESETDLLRAQLKQLESRLGGLEVQNASLHQLVGSGASRISQAPGSDSALALSSLAGAWVEEVTTSRVYARVIRGQLVAAYCYEGNHALSGLYFDWRIQDEWIFARYAWRKEPITGFSFLRRVSHSSLEGHWWLDSDADASKGMPSDPINRYAASWRRREESVTPDWAEACFAEIERIGLEAVLAGWPGK
jgi:nucleoside 2-deoxyribosyltransferase